MDPASRNAQRLALIVPALLLGGALISEYVFGLFPCEMCWWQRYGHMAALVFAALSYLAAPRQLWIALAALGILASGLIGGFHAGVEYGWWEGFTQCTSNVAEGADPLEAIFEAPIVRCDEVPWSLAGISLAGFNFLISTGAAIAIFVLFARKRS